ncbi:MAG: hypothetical protein K6A72_07850 [Lachnospiraceae bacterium]|nr:hypothetical protein [Lachnospiraceae bacterium]
MDFQQKQQQQNKQLFSDSSLNKTQEVQSDLLSDYASINRTMSEDELDLNKTAEDMIQANKSEVVTKSTVKEEQPQVLSKQAPEENRFIGLEKCFAYKQDGDSDRMLALRKAIKAYHDASDEKKGKYAEMKALKNIIKACKKYRFMRFSLFKRGKALERLNQVIALQEKVSGMADNLQVSLDQHKDDYIYNDSDETYKYESAMKLNNSTNLAQKIASGVIGGIAFLVYNPIRLAGAALMAPVWAINEGVRAAEKKITGSTERRSIRMGWKWKPSSMYFKSLKVFYNMSDHYTSVGRTVLNRDILESPKDLEKFRKIPGVKVDTKKGTVEIEENGEKTKYRVSFEKNDEEGTGKNSWYRIIKQKDPKTGKMKTVEEKVSENETISVEEFAKIGKKKVSKNYDLEKAEMDAIRAELNGEEDDLYDYEEDEEEEKEIEEVKEEKKQKKTSKAKKK